MLCTPSFSPTASTGRHAATPPTPFYSIPSAVHHPPLSLDKHPPTHSTIHAGVQHHSRPAASAPPQRQGAADAVRVHGGSRALRGGGAPQEGGGGVSASAGGGRCRGRAAGHAQAHTGRRARHGACSRQAGWLQMSTVQPTNHWTNSHALCLSVSVFVCLSRSLSLCVSFALFLPLCLLFSRPVLSRSACSLSRPLRRQSMVEEFWEDYIVKRARREDPQMFRTHVMYNEVGACVRAWWLKCCLCAHACVCCAARARECAGECVRCVIARAPPSRGGKCARAECAGGDAVAPPVSLSPDVPY